MNSTEFKAGGEYLTRDGRRWRSDGRFYDDTITALDIMPPKRVIWINVSKHTTKFNSRADADLNACLKRTECLRIEYAPGEGLSTDTEGDAP